ncbi:MAG: hypothetical protein ACYTGQ_11150 [Planctomycetota bacterium]
MAVMIEGQQLDVILRRTGQRRQWVSACAALFAACALAITCGLVAVLLDAFFGLGAGARVALNLLLGAVAIGSAVYIARVILRHGYDAHRMARLIEDRMGFTHNPLVNAIELDDSETETDGTSPALRALAVRQGLANAKEVEPALVVDGRGLRQSVWLTLGAVLIVALLFGMAPRVFTMVLPRMLAPSADLPPFTLVRFDVGVEPSVVPFGQGAMIRVGLSGPIVPDRANVVFIEGAERSSLPMSRSDEGAFVLPIDALTEPKRFYIQTPHGRSHTQTLEPSMEPLIRGVTVSYDYPAYTGWPRVERALVSPQIGGLVGTRVSLKLRSNVELAGGELRLKTDEASGAFAPVALEPVEDDTHSVRGSFELTSTGSYEATLTGAKGLTSQEAYGGAIDVKADTPPRVQLLEPDLRVMAPEGWTAPVAFAVNDDVGVARLAIKYRLEPTTEGVATRDAESGDVTEVTPPLQRRGAAYASARHDLNLSDLGAAAGDTVIGFATAFDNHPAPARSADSASFRIAVITRREYEELARRQYTIERINEEMAAFDEAERGLDTRREAAIEALAELQKELRENGGELTEEGQRKLDDIRHELESQRRAAEKLAEAMRHRAEQPQLYEFEQALSEQLNESADRLERQAESGAPGDTGEKKDPADEIAQMLERLREDQNAADEARSRSEMTVQQMEQMETANRVMMYADWVMDITRRQREVADRLAEYRDLNVLMFDERARLDRLAEEQAALADELRQALDERVRPSRCCRRCRPRRSSSPRRSTTWAWSRIRTARRPRRVRCSGWWLTITPIAPRRASNR